MSPKKVSVSIVSYNNRGFLSGCLSSLKDQDYPELEVVLVDNNSTDGTVEYVRDDFPWVRVIVNESNRYFCDAQNIGVKNTSGEYVLALNTDVELEKNFVSEMVRAMEPDERIGSVSGKILRRGGGLVDTTGLFLGRDRRPVERGYGEPDQGRYEEPGYIFGAGGAAPLYRRAMLEDVAVDGEYFDRLYEAFYEDLDLAWRAHNRGWKAFYSPRAVAYHARGGTARTERPSLEILRGYAFPHLADRMKAGLVRNRWLTIIKNDKPLNFLLNLPFILFYDIKIWAFLIFFSPKAIPGVVRGVKALPGAWRQRKRIHGA